MLSDQHFLSHATAFAISHLFHAALFHSFDLSLAVFSGYQKFIIIAHILNVSKSNLGLCLSRSHVMMFLQSTLGTFGTGTTFLVSI